MKITLDSGEMATARMEATLRRYINEELGSREKHFSRNAFTDEVNGLVAELAFAKWMNVYPDLGRPRAGSYDCLVKGKRVDVKAVQKPGDQLIAPSWKKLDCADIYVLGIVTDNEVNFVGWVPAEEFICTERITDLGYGPTYVLPQSGLRQFGAWASAAAPPVPAA